MLGIPDAYGIAFKKLKNMVEAARLVAKSGISGKALQVSKSGRDISRERTTRLCE